MALKLCTFNCRGLQDFVKRRKTFHYLRSINSDIVYLQETHSDPNDEKLWKSQWGEQAWFSSGTSNSKGVAILIRNSVKTQVHSVYSDPNGRFLIISVTINGLPLLLVNVYAPNNDDPDFYLQVFAKVNQFDYSSLIVGGDFNAVMGPLDYQGGRERHSNVKSSDIISILMDDFNLCDIWRDFHPNLKQYTRHQKSPKVLSRLDFILVSDNLINNCVSSKIIPGIQSDHSIVTLQFNDGLPSKGPGFWKLNCNFLHHDSDFVNLIKTKIKEFKEDHCHSDCNPNILWDALKCTITGVCIDYSSRKKKERIAKKTKIMKDIDKVNQLIAIDPSDTLLSQRESLQTELNKILDYETKGLIIRSRTRWMEEGEKSSKYFCNLEKRNSERKAINRLKKNNDEVIAGQSDVIKEIHLYFNNLYSLNCVSTGNSNDFESFLGNLDIPKLSDDHKQILDQPISKSELYNTLTSMKHNKTPGFDGLPCEFYIVFWQDIFEFLINSYNYSMANGLLSQSQRNGIISLLPKKDKDANYIHNYRPISLLTVDYKIIAKTLANRMKKYLCVIINSDQSGFLKGRNIGNNIRLIMDVLEYTEFNHIPGAILLLDIEKAFDSVSHDFLFTVLKHFNFGNNFINWVRMLYSDRKSYVINNGFLTNPIQMNNGIFQGCPISPYLFLLVIETAALAIRQNKNIKGIPIEDYDLKISLYADDSVCFLDGSHDSFVHLFDTFDKFARCSGCKINLLKSEAIWIGCKKGSSECPFSNRGLIWKQNQFKSLGIHFSINVKDIFDLNYKVKLKQIEGTLNCWRTRNLSLVGKICVIKTLLLPQLIFLFSVLSIKIPKLFFDQLNKLFFKFIWSGGNDRVKRHCVCNDYSQGGLRMVDPYSFALAQKMTWVKLLFDNKFESTWKTIELSALDSYGDILWISYAPESILNRLANSQLADSIRTWYVFRERAVKEIYDCNYSDLGACQCLWYNRNIRSKSKQFFYYEEWHDKGILYISDLLDPPHPGAKLFEELILDFEVSRKDRRKYNFLMQNIPSPWLEVQNSQGLDNFDRIFDILISTPKVPRYAYGILLEKCIPDKRIHFWENLFDSDLSDDPEDLDWDEIHVRNFKCSIDSRLRSFYFKVFHNAIAFNEFLYKIKRKDSPDCVLCKKFPESIIHFFCKCEAVKPLWDDLINIIRDKHDTGFSISYFDMIFGIQDDRFITYLFLCLKYFLYLCKFQNKIPNFAHFINFVKSNRETEYFIAKRRDKLSNHYKKWRFDF